MTLIAVVLPPRAPSEPRRPLSNPHVPATSPDSRPLLIVAVALQDVERFPAGPFSRSAVRTTAEAIRLIGQSRPQIVALDWDLPEFDHHAICGAAKLGAPVSILALMASPHSAPSALKAECHAVLLKPFLLNLISARIGRLYREMPTIAAASRLGAPMQTWGTNRTWPAMRCPHCSAAGAVSFEYSSHRRSWYACLRCEHVWLGPRRE